MAGPPYAASRHQIPSVVTPLAPPGQIRPGDPIRYDGHQGVVVAVTGGYVIVDDNGDRESRGQFNCHDLTWTDGAWTPMDGIEIERDANRTGERRWRGSIAIGIGESNSVRLRHIQEAPMSAVEALKRLRELQEGTEPTSSVTNEDDDVVDPTELDSAPERSASQYIGDVLDALVDKGFLDPDDIDGAATAIANHAEDGIDKVIGELLRKGHVKGTKILGGGQKEMRQHVARAMAEAFENIANSESLTEARRPMSEAQKQLRTRLENAVHKTIRRLLQKEGLDHLETIATVGNVKRRLRGMSEHIARKSRIRMAGGK
jgi:hypothetical protein